MKRVFCHIGFSTALTLLVINLVAVEYVKYITAGLALLLGASLVIEKYRQALAVPLCIGSALFACLVSLCVYYSAVEPALSLSGKVGEFSFYLTGLSEFKDGKYIYNVKTTQILLDGAPQTLKLKLYSGESLPADVYTVINASGKFFTVGNNAFNTYGAWSDGVYLNANINSFAVTDVTVSNPLFFIPRLQNDIIETFMKNIGFEAGAFSAALVTGDKYYFTQEMTEAFRNAGASHIVAVSGLHLNVISGSLYFVLKKLCRNKYVNVCVTLAVTFLYMALANFSGSVVRAGIMLFVLIVSDLFGRKADILNSLGIAVFIICLNPFAVGDISSVLSSVCVFALSAIYPQLNSSVPESLNGKNGVFAKTLRYLLKSFLPSLSVLLVSLPVLYVFFGHFTLAILFSNIFLIPLGSAATVLSFLTYLSCKLNELTSLFVFLTSRLNKLILFFVAKSASLTLLNISFNYYFGIIVGGILLIVAAYILFFNKLNKKYLFIIIFSILILFLAINLFWQYNNFEVIKTV